MLRALGSATVEECLPSDDDVALDAVDVIVSFGQAGDVDDVRVVPVDDVRSAVT
jgi:hypothetical protein